MSLCRFAHHQDSMPYPTIPCHRHRVTVVERLQFRPKANKAKRPQTRSSERHGIRASRVRLSVDHDRRERICCILLLAERTLAGPRSVPPRTERLRRGGSGAASAGGPHGSETPHGSLNLEGKGDERGSELRRERWGAEGAPVGCDPRPAHLLGSCEPLLLCTLRSGCARLRLPAVVLLLRDRVLPAVVRWRCLAPFALGRCSGSRGL